MNNQASKLISFANTFSLKYSKTMQQMHFASKKNSFNVLYMFCLKQKLFELPCSENNFLQLEYRL